MKRSIFYLTAVWLSVMGRPATSCLEELEVCDNPPCVHSITCEQGICNPVTGIGCVCENCQTGSDCSIKVTDLQIAFSIPHEEIEVIDAIPGKSLYQAEIDVSQFCPQFDRPCECVDLKYEVEDETALFGIREDGEVYLQTEIEVSDVQAELTIIAVNMLHPQEPVYMRLVVHLLNTLEPKYLNQDGRKGPRKSGKYVPPRYMNTHFDDEETLSQMNIHEQYKFERMEPSKAGRMDNLSHSRTRRQIYLSNYTVTDDIQFIIDKKAGFENITELSPGDRMQVELAIVFSGNISSFLLEVFSPENQTLVSIISSAGLVHQGSCLIDFSIDDVNAAMVKGRTNERAYPYYDLWQFNIESVYVDPGCAQLNDVAEHTLMFEYEFIMIQPEDGGSINGSERMACGASYLNDSSTSYVYISQVLYTPVFDPNVTSVRSDSENSSVTLTGPCEIGIGEASSFLVNMTIPHTYEHLDFDLYLIENDTSLTGMASFCKNGIVARGTNFLSLDPIAVRKEENFTDSGILNRVGYDFGLLINPDSSDVAESYITIQAVVNVLEDTSLIGRVFWVSAAATIGQDLVWVVSAQVTIAPSDSVNITNEDVGSDPVINYSISSSEVKVGEVISFSVDVEFPATHRYLASIDAYGDDPANQIFEVCDIRIDYMGDDLMCGNVLLNGSRTSYNLSLFGYTDRMTMDLGFLHSSGFNTDPEYNKLGFTVYFDVINEPINSSVGVILDLDPTYTWVSKAYLNLSTTTPTIPIPEVEISCVNKTAYPGEHLSLYITLALEPGTNIPSFSITAASSQNANGLVDFEIAKIELVTAGSNYPCAWQASRSASTGDNGTMTWLSMRGLHNIGTPSSSTVNDTVNQAVFRVAFQYQYNSLNAPTDVYPVILLAVDIEGGSMLLATETFTGKSSNQEFIDQHAASMTPDNFTLDSMSIPALVCSRIPFTITAPVSAQSVYTLIISSADPNFLFTNAEVTSAGSNYFCAEAVKVVEVVLNNGSAEVTLSTLYREVTDQSGIDDKVQLDLIGYYQLVVNETVNLTAQLDVQIKYGNQQTSISNNILVYPLQLPSLPAEQLLSVCMKHVEHSLSSAPETLNDTTLIIGETRRIIVTMNVTGNITEIFMNVYVLTTRYGSSPILDIESVRLLNSDLFTCVISEYAKQINDSSAELELEIGRVQYDSSPVDEQIQLEVMARARQGQEFSVDNATNLAVAVTLNFGEQVTISSEDLTFVESDTLLYSGFTAVTSGQVGFDVEATSVLSLNIPTSIELSLTVPRFSTIFVTFNVSQNMPVFNVLSLSLQSAGVNVEGITYDSEDVSFNPSGDRDQTKFTVGTITNTGKSYRDGTNNTDADDLILFSLTYELVDDSEHVLFNESSYSFTITPFVNGVPESSVQRDVDVSTVGWTPNLNISVTSNCSVLTDGDGYFATLTLKNSQPSRAARNTDVVLYTPPFLEYDAIIETKLNSVGTTNVALTPQQYQVLISVPTVAPGASYEILVRFTVVRATNKTGPSKVDIPWKASYKFYNSTWEVVKVPMSHVTCQTDMDTWGQDTEVCNSPVAAGMQSGAIIMDQIIAAPLQPGSTVDFIRPGGSTYMSFGKRIPADLYQEHRYVQIDLLSQHTVTTFTVNCTSSGYYAQTHTSKDGIAWVTSSSFNGTDGESIPLGSTLRYFRITFEAPADLEIKLELYACRDNSLAASANTYPAEFDWAPRQMATMDHHLYVCDTKPSTKLPSTCFIHDVLNNKWRVMNRQLNNLIGYDSVTSRFYGISKYGQYMMSSNNGTKWSVIPGDYYSQEQGSLQPVTNVPWIVPLDDHTVTIHKVSTPQFDFAADGVGIHKSASAANTWQKVVDWETLPNV